MTPSEPLVGTFREMLFEFHEPAVLEVGTKRSQDDRPTHHRGWAPHATFTLADIEAGVDVDAVEDIHATTFSPAAFHAVIACSVFEHLARPWLAAIEIARILKPGGLVYVQTHQTFPIHGYPSDYWRFTTEALTLIFADAGMETLDAGYQFPATITPPGPVERGWNEAAPAFLNVDLIARMP